MASGALVPHGPQIVALSWGDLDPLKWLGAGASAVVGDGWKAAMTALWSAGLWVLDLAFKIIDAFTTPNLTASGPLATILPYTFAIGGFLAVLMALLQIGVALYKRDGQSVARIIIGALQFGAVWVGYIGIAAALVEATAGLTQGLLQGLLHVTSFSGFSNSAGWPRNIDDTVVATVLGLCTVFIIFPAAIGYITIMLVREAALLLLTATSPIAAGGLISDGTRAWFWKSLRWFLATLLIAPLAALVLGIGVQITNGTIQGKGDKTAAAVGMAVTGCILILIGAVCPLILFRLLAFVDPGTSSGAALRQSLAANGGIAGMLGGTGASDSGGSGGGSGSGAATQQDGGGRSQGEASADSQTASRFSGMLGGAGQAVSKGMGAVGTVASKTASVGSDVLGSAGVGHQAPYFGQDQGRGGNGASPGGGTIGDSSGGRVEPGTDSSGDQNPAGGAGGDSGRQPSTPPTPPMHPTPPTPGGGSAGAMPGGGSGAPGGVAGAAEAVPVVAV